MTGRLDKPLPVDWDQIPGARGCPSQSCSYRDLYAGLKLLRVNNLYGLSTQNTEYQKEVVKRLNLPYEILSELILKPKTELNLSTFNVNGMILLKRLTMVIEKDKIIRVFYPEFLPDGNANTVLNWL